MTNTEGSSMSDLGCQISVARRRNPTSQIRHTLGLFFKKKDYFCRKIMLYHLKY
jgi:hypothetical protein